MSFRPIFDRVLVKLLSREDRTKIHLPSMVLDRMPHQGKVIAVGDGMVAPDGHLVPVRVKAGDVILFRPQTGLEINVDDEDCLLLEELNILGVME